MTLEHHFANDLTFCLLNNRNRSLQTNSTNTKNAEKNRNSFEKSLQYWSSGTHSPTPHSPAHLIGFGFLLKWKKLFFQRVRDILCAFIPLSASKEINSMHFRIYFNPSSLVYVMPVQCNSANGILFFVFPFFFFSFFYPYRSMLNARSYLESVVYSAMLDRNKMKGISLNQRICKKPQNKY